MPFAMLVLIGIVYLLVRRAFVRPVGLGDHVSIESIAGQEFMFYRSFTIDVGIFRASSVDQVGNSA